ncbi:TPA: hypothetical protein DCE37_17510 [Candidatus Latescibacteria bacterium]|nr:hypothetical protein [Candidatus Latescibacterota bacterium]
MTRSDLNIHLNSLFSDLKEDTVDRIIYDAPHTEITGIAVAWMPYRETIQKAMDLGANVLVTHEPTFYISRDLRDDHLGGQEVDDKREWLDAQDITIIRCHDVWDAIPDIGIPYAWAISSNWGHPASRSAIRKSMTFHRRKPSSSQRE